MPDLINTENIISRKVLFNGIFLLIGCFTLILIPWFRIFSISISNADYVTIYFLVSRILCWCILGIIFIYVRKKEKQNILLWSETEYSIGTHVAFFFIMLLVLFTGLAVIHLILNLMHLASESSQMAMLKYIFKNYKLLVPVTTITAGVTEELIFRGYLMPRLELLYNNKYVTVIVSSLLFGMIHIGYGTVINVVATAFIGFIFALHYQKYRNIGFLIFFHFIWDTMAAYVLLRNG